MLLNYIKNINNNKIYIQFLAHSFILLHYVKYYNFHLF